MVVPLNSSKGIACATGTWYLRSCGSRGRASSAERTECTYVALAAVGPHEHQHRCVPATISTADMRTRAANHAAHICFVGLAVARMDLNSNPRRWVPYPCKHAYWGHEGNRGEMLGTHGGQCVNGRPVATDQESKTPPSLLMLISR
jgi:hypothetical protein